MFGRFLFLAIGLPALMVLLSDTGQLQARPFRGGFRPGARPMVTPRFRGGFRPGFGFDRRFRGGRFNPRFGFDRRFRARMFDPRFDLRFRGGMFDQRFRTPMRP